MKRLAQVMYWQFLIYHRNNLIYISIAVSAMYALIFYFIKDLPNTDRFLVLLIYNDPAVIGLLFIGLSLIMEKNESVLPALLVTPMSWHHYFIAKILDLSIIGCLCAVAMAMAMQGLHISWSLFCFGVFATCMIFSIAGLFVISYTYDFLSFMLRSIPILLILSCPLLNYFEVSNIALFSLTPIHGPLQLIIESISGNTYSLSSTLPWFASTILWSGFLYFFTYRIFVNRVRRKQLV